MQSNLLVELASVALAMVLVKRVAAVGRLNVTEYGERANYRARTKKVVLEISGTEAPAELHRRQRDKIAQARRNPFGWDAYVVVCLFSSAALQVRFSRHSIAEAKHGESEI